MSTSRTSPRRRRRHPAAVARIVAAGVAATSTFGLVAMLGLTRAKPADRRPVALHVDPAALPSGSVAPLPPGPADLGGGSAPASVPTPSAPVTRAPRADVPVTRSTAS